MLADFAAQPVALADYSQDADVTTELVDVGAGADAAAYQGKDVRGKLVLADGPLPAVHRLAVEERGAAGIVSDFPNQRTAWSGLDPDLVRWGHLSPYQTANRFAFMISPRTAGALRQELAHGAVRLAAHVQARMVPGELRHRVGDDRGHRPRRRRHRADRAHVPPAGGSERQRVG